MPNLARFFFVLLIVLLAGALMLGCGDDDDDDNDTPDDDTSDDDDDTVDDDTIDDDDDNNDTSDDDTNDDDTGDDDTFDDTYVAPWPQDPTLGLTYNETPDAGPLREKVDDYDLWHETYHQPYYGNTVGAYFTDDSYTDVAYYFETNDSCIWTGTYLAAQAFRYVVTGDEQAKTNAIRIAEALDGNLHITGRPGFIARYRALQDPQVMPGDCDTDPECHIVDEGPYAGDFWRGNTSRDQYTGWFLGMGVAYDLIDDEDMREMIRDDVIEVLDDLIAHKWLIVDADGWPTTKAPNVLMTQKMAWTLIGYHLTGYDRYKQALQKWIRNDRRIFLRLLNISGMNRYTQYFGNNLSHENFYSLLRLARVYFSPDDYEFIQDVFDNQVHTFTRLSHNALFTAVHMTQGLYEPEERDDPYQAQLEEDLTDFMPPPKYDYFADPQGVLDPVSVFLDDLMEQFPFLQEIMGDVDPQALNPFPVDEQCAKDFQWQGNPFKIGPCGAEQPLQVNAGVDYIVAYWMSAYHQLLLKNQ